MNCPHCGYEERTFNNEACEYEYNGEYGCFYKLDQMAFRGIYNLEVFGCPKCKIMFMDY